MVSGCGHMEDGVRMGIAGGPKGRVAEGGRGKGAFEQNKPTTDNHTKP